MKLVEVSWIDSYVDGGWSEYKPERKCTYTYGLLVNQNEEWVTLYEVTLQSSSQDYSSDYDSNTDNVLEKRLSVLISPFKPYAESSDVGILVNNLERRRLLPKIFFFK